MQLLLMMQRVSESLQQRTQATRNQLIGGLHDDNSDEDRIDDEVYFLDEDIGDADGNLSYACAHLHVSRGLLATVEEDWRMFNIPYTYIKFGDKFRIELTNGSGRIWVISNLNWPKNTMPISNTKINRVM